MKIFKNLFIACMLFFISSTTVFSKTETIYLKSSDTGKYLRVESMMVSDIDPTGQRTGGEKFIISMVDNKNDATKFNLIPQEERTGARDFIISTSNVGDGVAISGVLYLKYNPEINGINKFSLTKSLDKNDASIFHKRAILDGDDKLFFGDDIALNIEKLALDISSIRVGKKNDVRIQPVVKSNSTEKNSYYLKLPNTEKYLKIKSMSAMNAEFVFSPTDNQTEATIFQFKNVTPAGLVGATHWQITYKKDPRDNSLPFYLKFSPVIGGSWHDFHEPGAIGPAVMVSHSAKNGLTEKFFSFTQNPDEATKFNTRVTFEGFDNLYVDDDDMVVLKREPVGQEQEEAELETQITSEPVEAGY
ncbi:MAG: hypothetical protein WC436_03630 [Candidatus Babeliales bacterium]